MQILLQKIVLFCNYDDIDHLKASFTKNIYCKYKIMMQDQTLIFLTSKCNNIFRRVSQSSCRPERAHYTNERNNLQKLAEKCKKNLGEMFKNFVS